MTVANAKPDQIIRGPLGTATVNAASSAWWDVSTVEAKISEAIAYAVSIGAKYCYVPDCFLPYTAGSVTFNNTVQMLREGGAAAGDGYDIRAYGAAGNGVQNDLAAIQAAINAASVSDFAIGGEVQIPAGRYIVNGPIIMKTNVALIGMGWRPVWGWNATTGPFLPSMIAANPATWVSGDPVIDNRGSVVTRIEELHIQGTGTVNADQTNATSIGIMYGRANQASDSNLYAQHALVRCNIVAHKTGVWLKDANLFMARENNIAGNWNMGIFAEQFCGDSLYLHNYIDRNQELYASDTFPGQGVGLYLGPGSWNSSIVGGKIENNAVGVELTETGGVMFNGVVFEANSRRAVWLQGGAAGPYPTTSNVFAGCRFYSNGYNNVGGQSTHIQLSAGAAGQRVGLTVSGCTLKRGNFPTSSVDYPSSGTIGPDYAVLARSAGLMTVTVVGNDMDDSCTNQATGAIRIEAGVDAGTLLQVSNNIGNPAQQVLNASIPTPKELHANFSGAQASTTSTSDVSLKSYSLPAGSLAVNGQAVRVIYRGLASTQNCVPTLKFGTLTLIAGPTVVAGNVFQFDVLLTRTGSATQTAITFLINGTAVTSTSVNGTENLANAVLIDFRGSVVSGGTLFANSTVVELIAP